MTGKPHTHIHTHSNVRAKLRHAGRQVNALLSNLGIRIQRVPKNKKAVQMCSETAGKIVECIGVSGTGKTTTINAFRERCAYRWLFEYETLGSSCVDVFNVSDEEFVFDYTELMQRQSKKTLTEDYAILHKAKLVQWTPVRLQQEIALFAAGEHENIGFWFDDGILHNFTDVILEFFAESAVDQIPMQRTLVLLEAEPETVFIRLKQRSLQKPNAGNNWLAACGEDEVMMVIEKRQNAKRNLYKQWKLHGGTAYRVSIEDIDTAVEELLCIEKELIGQ